MWALYNIKKYYWRWFNMSSKVKGMQKKIYSHNAYACILNMSDYMSKHSMNKKTWTYKDVVFRLHLDYKTHREIVKYKDQYYKRDSYLMDKIYKIYNAMKKPTQDRTIRMQKIVDNVAQKVKKQQDKKIHEIVPLSFSFHDKEYGNMPLKYLACRIIYDDSKYWDPDYNEEDLDIDVSGFVAKFKEAIHWDQDEYDKLHKLIRALNEDEFFNTLDYLIKAEIPADTYNMVRLVLFIVAYVYGVNTNFLLCNTSEMVLFERLSGEYWQEEHLRFKMLWLYDSGVFTDLYKEDNELTKFKNILIYAPLNKYRVNYPDLEYFCNKYNLNIDAMTGKFLPLREDIPAMSSMEFKDQLRFKDYFLKDITV